MRVFLDTNIIFSAILFPNSIPDKALQKALIDPYEAVTCDYVIEELRRNFIKKFPNKVNSLEIFLVTFSTNVEIVKISFNENDLNLKIRDAKDKPILKAALDSRCDLLITGDKDFLESGLKNPIIIKASDFYLNY